MYQPYPIYPSVQNRLNQLEQQFPQYTQPQYSGYPQPQNSLKGRPVTSLEEARASMIDLDGSVSIFPDFGNGKIYTKQLNLDGTATLNSYSLDRLPHSSPEIAGVLKSEPNTDDRINLLQQQIDDLKDEIQALQTRRDKNVSKSNANDASVQRNEKSNTGDH